MKQLFLYLTAEYETPNNQLNQVRLSSVALERCEGTVREVQSNTMLWADLDVLEQWAVWSGPAFMLGWSCKLRTNIF